MRDGGRTLALGVQDMEVPAFGRNATPENVVVPVSKTVEKLRRSAPLTA